MTDESNVTIAELVETVLQSAVETTEPASLPFSTIEEYKVVTGKRFRTNPEQKARGLTREQAFAEFCETLRNKGSAKAAPVAEV